MACSRCGNGLGTCVCQSSAGPGMVWDNDSPTGRQVINLRAIPHHEKVNAFAVARTVAGLLPPLRERAADVADPVTRDLLLDVLALVELLAGGAKGSASEAFTPDTSGR